DLMESHTGREMLEIRDQLDASRTERDRHAAQIQSLEEQLRTFSENETALRSELGKTRRQRDEAATRAEAISESQTLKDNEVLRGIVNRLNIEVAQQTGEVHRLKRARYALKIAYVMFGLGLVAVVIFALIVLPRALRP